MPSAEAGWVVFSSSALICCPCSRSTTQRPVASRCSPAETEVVLPRTVTKSWWLLTCTLSTANPFSGLWKVTRSIRRVSFSGMAGVTSVCDSCGVSQAGSSA